MIKISNLSKKFEQRLVLDNINLEFQEGQKVLITGQNGAGKTTLMKAILGQIICSGEILINGLNPIKERKKALAHIGFVPQMPPPLKLSVSELCEFAIKTSNAKLDDIKSILDELKLDFSKESNKPFLKLSGGMKQKILIAIALAKNSDILMFDEPTANLDPSARECFLSLLSKKFSQKTIIFISHRLKEVDDMVDTLVAMDLGKVESITHLEAKR